jgi:hypothetical protein
MPKQRRIFKEGTGKLKTKTFLTPVGPPAKIILYSLEFPIELSSIGGTGPRFKDFNAAGGSDILPHFFVPVVVFCDFSADDRCIGESKDSPILH